MIWSNKSWSINESSGGSGFTGISRAFSETTRYTTRFWSIKKKLAIINKFLAYITVLLLDNRFFNYQIEDILSILEYLFCVHEAYYGALTHFVNQLDIENSPLLSDFEELHQEWRETGNINLRVYRLFEGRLNINPANSRIPE